MSKYNLIDEKWIPVRYPDGSRDELGIRETLLRSKEIMAIEDPSPLVIAALHRLLLAVLYRALKGPTDIDKAKKLFKEGLPPKAITDYLDTWTPRFWLFDEKYPFAQVPSVPVSEAEPWTKLTAEYNARSNKVLFDHTDTTNTAPISPGESARWIAATLNFSVRGGRGYRPSPSSDAVFCIPVGDNLQQTLLCSLVPYPNRMVVEEDLPIWEREPRTYAEYKAGIERPARGFADLYTWRARAMRLLPVDENGRCKEVAFIPGVGYTESEIRDPLTPFMRTNRGIEQVQWEDRGLWRSFTSLLPDADSQDGLEPRVISHLASLSRTKLIAPTLSFHAIGQKFKNAAIDFWRMERYQLSNTTDRSFKQEIQAALDLAEETGTVLERALKDMAKAIIAKDGRDLMPDKWVAGQKKPGDESKYVMSLGVLPLYWSALEGKFHEILQHYTLGRDPNEIELEWLEAVRGALRDAWTQHRSSVSTGDAWAIRAVVKAEGRIAGKLKELGQKIDEFKEYLKKEGA